MSLTPSSIDLTIVSIMLCTIFIIVSILIRKLLRDLRVSVEIQSMLRLTFLTHKIHTTGKRCVIYGDHARLMTNVP